jgi:hypothetical protein
MINKTFVNAYFADINLICEDRNFFGVFETPKDLVELDLDAEELEYRINQRIQANSDRNFRLQYLKYFDHMDIDEENPQTIKIYLHIPHDDYTEEEKEEFLNNIQNSLS